MNNDFDALGLDALHDALDARCPKVLRYGLHDVPVNAVDLGIAADELFGDDVLAGGVGLDDGMDEVLRHIVVVSQKLLAILGQAVAAVAEAGVVVMRANARVEADAVDDLASVQAMGGGVSVELIEVGHAHGKVSVSEELDCLSFRAVSKKSRYVRFDRALLEKTGEDFCSSGLFADDDAAGVQAVVERPTFAQEFWGEDEVLRTEGLLRTLGVADRNGGLDDHHRSRIDGHDVPDDRFDGLGIEVVGLGVVVGGGGGDDVVGADVGFLFVERCAKLERLILEELFDAGIFDWRFLSVQHRHFLWNDIEADYIVVLRQ